MNSATKMKYLGLAESATPEQIADAWEWVSDCVWADEPNPDCVPAWQLIRGIDRNYEGGWAQFLADGQPA